MRRGVAMMLVVGQVLAGTSWAAGPPARVPLPPAPPSRTPGPDPALPPYEDNLERLAELMGVLAFMQGLCEAGAGSDWRNKMTALIEAEGTTEQRRARLAGNFNRGFDSYRVIYRACTPAARLVVARSLAEGARLSSTLARLFIFD